MAEKKKESGVRLQKILSTAGVASRRASEQMIIEGRVTVNGETVRALGTRADPAKDAIKVDGRRIKLDVKNRYIVLYKPKGYVTTRSDPERRPTIMDLIGEGAYIYPVGRLDFDSEGLLLMMTDGDLAAKLTHPRHEVDKVYEVIVLGVPDPKAREKLRKGVFIDGRRTSAAEHDHFIDLVDFMARMREFRGEVTVGHHQQQAFRVEVQTSDGIDVSALANQVHDRRPLLGVASRGDIAFRLVEDEVAVLDVEFDASAVDLDGVCGGISLGAERAHGFAVDRHPALENHLLRGAPRRHAGRGQDFLKAYARLVLFFSHQPAP